MEFSGTRYEVKGEMQGDGGLTCRDGRSGDCIGAPPSHEHERIRCQNQVASFS